MTTASQNATLASIVISAQQAYDKMHQGSMTSVGLLQSGAVIVDCHLTGLRIVVARRDRHSNVCIAVGRKGHYVEKQYSFNPDAFAATDVLQVMEELFKPARSEVNDDLP